MSKVVIIKNNGKVQQIRQYAEESYNTGELGIIQLRKDQKMNYSLRKSRSVQKGKKRRDCTFVDMLHQ